MIELSNIHFSFERSNPILSGFNLSVQDNEFISLMGDSGSGKTTILNLISGIIQPQIGEILVNGDLLYLTQNVTLLPYMTALENCVLALKLRNKNNSSKIIEAEELVTKYGLGVEIKNKMPHELSGGMKQRIAIIQTMLVDSTNYLLDEPFNAIDRNNMYHILDNVWCKVKKMQASTIFVSHDLEQILLCSDRVEFVQKPLANGQEGIQFADSFRSLPPSLRRQSPLYTQYMLQLIKSSAAK